MKNAILVVPPRDTPINLEQVTVPVAVPAGTAAIRFSLVAAQPMRENSEFGSRLQIWWTDRQRREPIRRDPWESLPKPSWSPEEEKEGLPISGHTVGSPPGVIPYDVGPFAYAVEGSPAVNQIDVADNIEEYPLAFLRYTILGGNRGGPVNVAVVLEAMDADGNPLEFT